MLQQQSLFLIDILIFVSLLQTPRIEGVRLCGRRLADLLNFVCNNYGGFHSPGENNGNLQMLQDSDATASLLYNSESRKERELLMGMEPAIYVISKRNSGIVDECCKKQCSRATLLSYCAGVSFPISDDFILDVKNSSISSQENINDFLLEEQTSMTLNQQMEPSLNVQPSPIGQANVHQSQPNLGLSIRNRPIFIVLTRNEEASSEEYKM